jgi:hypothetical protein
LKKRESPKEIYVLDHKDSNNEWVRWSLNKETGYVVRYFTRGFKLWRNLEKRCSGSAKILKATPTYADCKNEFKSFQSFADWCQNQVGYLNKTSNGKYWCLDKDILVPGNKNYNEDSCAFVPHYINTLLLSRGYWRGEYPIGVSKDKERGTYIGQCNKFETKGITFCGRHDTPKEAHHAWQVEKAKQIMIAADVTKGLSEKVVIALRERAEKLISDNNLGLISEIA